MAESLMLPSGSSLLDDTLIICIGVTDSIGSTSYKFAREVAVHQPSISVADISAMVSSESGTFAELVKKGNPASLATLAKAMVSTMDTLGESKASTAGEDLDESNDEDKESNKGVFILSCIC